MSISNQCTRDWRGRYRLEHGSKRMQSVFFQAKLRGKDIQLFSLSGRKALSNSCNIKYKCLYFDATLLVELVKSF